MMIRDLSVRAKLWPRLVLVAGSAVLALLGLHGLAGFRAEDRASALLSILEFLGFLLLAGLLLWAVLAAPAQLRATEQELIVRSLLRTRAASWNNVAVEQCNRAHPAGRVRRIDLRLGNARRRLNATLFDRRFQGFCEQVVSRVRANAPKSGEHPAEVRACLSCMGLALLGGTVGAVASAAAFGITANDAVQSRSAAPVIAALLSAGACVYFIQLVRHFARQAPTRITLDGHTLTVAYCFGRDRIPLAEVSILNFDPASSGFTLRLESNGRSRRLRVSSEWFVGPLDELRSRLTRVTGAADVGFSSALESVSGQCP